MYVNVSKSTFRGSMFVHLKLTTHCRTAANPKQLSSLLHHATRWGDVF